MKKRYLNYLIITGMLFLAGCSNNKDINITNLSMLEGGKTFAVPTGTVADQFVLKRFPDAKLEYYNSVLDCALAVKGGKASAAVYDKPVLLNIAGKNEGLTVLNEMLVDDNYGFAVQLKDVKLKNTIDEVLDELKKGGIYEEMSKRWFPKKGNPEPMPEIELSGENGILKFGTAAVTEPMSFMDGNRKIVGFDIEFAAYIAKKLGKKLEIINMEFGAMLPALISGKVDMIGAGLSITEERAKSVLFSNSYYLSGIAAIVKSPATVSSNQTDKAVKMSSMDDLATKKIGIFSGTVHDAFLAKKYPRASVSRFESTADLILSVSTGKIDAAMLDLITAGILLKRNDDLAILCDDVLDTPLGVGFNKKNKALRDEFNGFLKEIRADGTHSAMHKRWFVDDPEKAVMPPFTNPSSDKKLVVAVSVEDLPYVAFMNGSYVGFDIEMIRLFAERRNYNLEIVPMEFPSLIAALAAGKADMITDGISISRERAEQIDFSDSYADFKTAVIVPKTSMAKYAGEMKPVTELLFWEKISNSFYNNIIREQRYLLILEGLKTTVFISVFAAFVGTLLGGLICFMRMSKKRALSIFAKFYISILRGTPVLVLLMIIYYIVFASVNINPVLVAIFAFGLNFAAYVSEMFRTSVESVDKGQKEAGIAGGFTKIQTFIYIILPQALRHVLPVYKGEFVSLVKMTSIVGYIAVQDLTKASDIIRSRTFDAFFPLIMAAVIYLVIAWLLTWALDYVEISVDPKRKKIKRAEEGIQ